MISALVFIYVESANFATLSKETKIGYFMRKLNLPVYEFKLREEEGKRFVMDIFRKKYVMLTPEEEVRQRFAQYLIREKAYPSSLMMTEVSMQLNKMSKRCDILVHKPAGEPAVLVECKAPEVKVTRATFDQAARYNMVFKVKYLMVTNGLKHYCCYVDFKEKQVRFLDEIPDYDALEV
jgi:hypothetical protein